MRLFAAIDIDEAARAAIAALRQRVARRLESGRSDLRWTGAEQLHLTLAFIGEVGDDMGAQVADAMSPAFAVPPYRLVLGGLGMFPPHGAPRVLWLGSLAGARETIDLQALVARRLTAIGISLERRPFQPHLTIGRWRDSSERDRRAIVQVADTGRLAAVDVDHVTLYQSRLSPRGPTYARLAIAALVPNASGQQ